jgi:hypothetical protein
MVARPALPIRDRIPVGWACPARLRRFPSTNWRGRAPSEQTEPAGIALKAAVSTLRRPARLPVRRLATTPPTTLAGVAAVLRFANEIEDGGMEWPATDAVGPEGWHYQLRATMAAAIEALIKAQAGKAVAS